MFGDVKYVVKKGNHGCRNLVDCLAKNVVMKMKHSLKLLKYLEGGKMSNIPRETIKRIRKRKLKKRKSMPKKLRYKKKEEVKNVVVQKM